MSLIISNNCADLFIYPGRVDLSVNNARIENPFSTAPYMHTGTGGNVANGFNGAGVGNKAILGFDVLDGMGLATLTSLSWTYTNLTPYIPVFWTRPYANLILQLDPLVATYNVALIDPNIAPALMQGSETINPDGSSTWEWLAGSDAMLIVNSTASFPAPTIPPIPVVSFGVGNYPNASYTIASLLASYPNAIFKKASSLDAGLPKATVTPAFMLIQGDSGNNTNINFKLGDILVNGSNV